MTDMLGDRYRLQRELATGGMGTVWEAADVVLGRRVAVKILSRPLASDERFVERFRREARAAAGLSHPNVAHIFDYGEDGDTRFIVMELLSGETLADRLLRQGRLDPSEAAAIAAQVADALDEAHRAGIVHRDVKPANIMLTPDGGVKVMDFGIAAAGRSSSLTATGAMIGTATYMSPEHATGGRVTPASDVYSLAVVLYEMLTGARPFERDTPIATAMAHVNVDPPPIRDLAPWVPASLATAVEQGMAKDPAARPRSAAAFAAMLRGVPAQPDKPVEAVKVPSLLKQNEPVSVRSFTIASSAERKAASVLPDPVGASSSVCSPRAIAGHPSSWASVGRSNEASNQPRTTGVNVLSGADPIR